MVVGRDVKGRTALGVQKACQVCASLMVEDAGASILNARRELKEARCSAKHMVEENVAPLKGAPKVPKEAPPFARVMVGGRGALSLNAQRVSMVGHPSV